MTVAKPFHRTCRQFSDGTYDGNGRWIYLLHSQFATEPSHYIQAFLLLQKDLVALFDYIEPAEANLPTYSHRVHQLLMSVCVEMEVNFTAILLENGYTKKGGGNLTMHDYRLVERSHRLSSYEARLPLWRGPNRVMRPFAAWASGTKPLPWYQAYNQSKHDRRGAFHLANFDAVLEAMCGLALLLSAQFCVETFSPAGKPLMARHYGASANDGMISAIGDLFRIKMPDDWPQTERYDFPWGELDASGDPFDNFDYSALA